MPAPSTELGSFREVWFAKVATPGTQYSFLVRDDSNLKTGSIVGRTVRLGDPISLGANSVWQQTTWEGGLDQERWNDHAMYRSGTADTSASLGRIQLPPGIKNILSEKLRGVTDFVIAPSTATYAADTRLWICESNFEPQRNDPTTGTAVPPTGYRVYSYNPVSGALTTVKADLPGPVISVSPWVNNALGLDSTSTFLMTVVTPGATRVIGAYIFKDTGTPAYVGSGSFTGATAKGIVYPNSFAAYNNAVYYGMTDFTTGQYEQPKLYVNNAAGNSLVKAFPYHQSLRAFTVWNNRVWFAAAQGDGNSSIHVTDGATTIPAFLLPDGLQVRKMVTVQGALYIVGYRYSASYVDGVIGEVWKYDGSRLTKLWSRGTGSDGFDWGVYDAAAHGKYLAWTLNGHTPATDKPGIMLYDTDLDSISPGPCMDMHASSTSYLVRTLVEYNNELAFSVWDTKNYVATVNQPTGVFLTQGAGKVRTQVTAAAYEGYSFESQSATLEREILSSRYDGESGTEAEQKVWLAGHLKVRLALADTSIVVKATIDDGTEYTITTIAYDSGLLGWRDVTVPLKSGGDYLVGHTIQYRFLLRNSSASATSAASPEVDNANFEYMLKPKKRRQWSIRAFLGDGQTTLAGSANPLTTQAAQTAKLEELWSDQRPVLFWEAGTTPGAPGGAGTEVYITQWSEQRYRIESSNTTVGAEVGLTLSEVVIS